MNDSELLHLAAKAAGVDSRVLAYDNDGTAGYWNPLEDDGDALRLAVLLDLPFRRAFNGTFETGNDKSGRPIWEVRGTDLYAAARRAIVRAAAAIGESMP